MQVWRCVCALFVFAVSVVAGGQTASKLTLARELVALTGGSGGVDPFLMMRMASAAAPPDSTEVKRLTQFEKDFAESDEAEAARIYADALTHTELEQLVAFFRTPAGRKFAAARQQVALAAQARVESIVTAGLREAVDLSKQKRTMADMMSIATASEAWATDKNRYPSVSSMQELEQILSPDYIRRFPRKDGWGTEFVYLTSPNGFKYRIISAGPDLRVDPSSRRLSEKPAQSDDIIYENGAFLQKPASVQFP